MLFRGFFLQDHALDGQRIKLTAQTGEVMTHDRNKTAQTGEGMTHDGNKTAQTGEVMAPYSTDSNAIAPTSNQKFSSSMPERAVAAQKKRTQRIISSTSKLAQTMKRDLEPDPVY